MIIGHGRPGGERAHWFLGSATGSMAKPMAAAAKMVNPAVPGGNIPDPRQIHSRIIAPGDAALLACLAGRAAATEELMARMVPQIRSLMARNPAVSPARIARLVLESELRGITATAGGLAGLLALDDFGQAVLAQSGPGTNQGTHSDDSKNPSRQSPGADPSNERLAKAEVVSAGSVDGGGQTGIDSEINTILDGLARPKPGRPGWHWFSLGGTDWSTGGSLRIAVSPSGRLVNLDVNVAEGCWQFHWSEPQRNRLYFARPEAGGNQFKLHKCLALLQEAIGPLGFGDFVEMNPKDWYDGFTYLPCASIISRVDIVT